jgi:hypothetical protein
VAERRLNGYSGRVKKAIEIKMRGNVMISRQAKKLVPAREQLQALTPAELTEVSGGGGGGGYGGGGYGGGGYGGGGYGDGDYYWHHHHHRHHHRRIIILGYGAK